VVLCAFRGGREEIVLLLAMLLQVIAALAHRWWS
jgi:hypothetical protein